MDLLGLDQGAIVGGAAQLLGTLFPGSAIPMPDGKNAASPTSFAFIAIRAILFAVVLNWARKLWSYVVLRLQKIVFPTAFISAQDPSHRWVTTWIASDPYAQAQFDDFVLHTREVSRVRGGAANALYRRNDYYGDSTPDDFTGEEATWKSGKVIGRMLPPQDQTIRIKFDGSYLWIRKANRYGSLGGDDIGVMTFGFQRPLLMRFLAAAHERYFAKEDHELLIFHTEASSYAAWMEPIGRPARPWGSVILPMKDTILKDMQRFLSDKETKWYAARGIPHRRGYLFHGEPGAGKTTLVTALASRLRLDIYVINVSQSGMDDNKLGELFRMCRTQSIILIEDIDRVFAGRDSISTSKGPSVGPARAGATTGLGGLTTPMSPSGGDDESISSDMVEQGIVIGRDSKKEASLVTMSGLLNAIDGVSSQEGCLLIASTNHPDKLDAALCRAGRFDVRVPFGSATPEQARALFLHFFPLEDFIDRTSKESEAASVEREPELDLDEKRFDVYDIKTQSEIDSLADDFARAVFPRGAAGGVGGEEGTRVAMASLQAYLLNFKEDPRAAVLEAAEWAKSAEKGGLMLRSPGLPELEQGEKKEEAE